MFEKVLASELLRGAADRVAAGRTLRLGGIWGSAAPLAAAALGRLTGREVLFVTTSPDAADDVADDLEVFSGATAQVFPAWEGDFTTSHVSGEVTAERMRLCNLLAKAPAGTDPQRQAQDEPLGFIVAPMMALLQPVPSPQTLAAGRLSLRKEAQLDPQELINWLLDAGFEEMDPVDEQGQFARRGGIVDVFPPGVSQAVRLEFFGDQIDSIRLFDLDTQRSSDQIDETSLMSLAAGSRFESIEACCLLDYLSPERIICMVEPAELKELARDLHRRGAAETTEAVGDDPSQMADTSMRFFDPEEVFGGLDRFARVEMHIFAPKRRPEALNLGVRSLQRMATNVPEALGELAELAEAAEIWLYCENAAEQKRFGELLAERQPKLAASGKIRTAIGHVAGGFHWPALGLVVVGHHEVFHRYAVHRRIRRVRTGRPIESFMDLQAGDYVVHVAHGIARFEGLRRLEQNGRVEEYLTLRFADNASLHVPAGQINLVQKYIGTRKLRPTLSKLGSGVWSRQKQRVGEAVQDLAAEMLRIQAARQAMSGTSYPRTSDWQKQFCGEFLYTETEDQLASMEQIDADMAAARPMDRLLCGDVGYGKTELAMRAAFKTAEAGRQAAVLVPTTVLAEQHYRTFKERLADYPVRVEMISRFRSPAQQTQIIKDLVLGRIDILIGTHRLLSNDVKFADLGLAIVDEEQRFGVEHKEHLKQMRTSVDVLTLTATPIPRTLHMALMGLRDISSLATAPLDRRAIRTEVHHYDEGLIRHAILRELNRQGQVFFVHNRVMDIEPLAERIGGLVPEAKMAIAHGQMAEHQLEKTMLRFIRQEIDVLVCTTIIESGLDIPNANTMIVNDADRFGLAQLHQLRGRVGRYKHLAFCYLLLPERRPVTPTAAKRLKAIEEFSDLGAGFQIAMRDLELRGAGNILGKAQSGHIAMVGYELYCQLLEGAVRHLRGEPAAARRDAHVELGVDAYIPRSYIPSERQRMEIYRRLVGAAGQDDLNQLSADLADAYGAAPPEVQTLIDVAEIRVRAGQFGIESIVRMDPDIIFSVVDFQAAAGVFEGAAGSVRLPDERTVHWRPPPAYLEAGTLIRVLLKRFSDAAVPV